MRDSDRGAALLVVLLMVATLSVISVGILQTVTRSVQIASLAGARGQVSWYLNGAETLAAVKISQLNELSEGQITRFSPGLSQELLFPFDGGQIVARVDEATNCFNLNSLGQSDDGEAAGTHVDADAFYVELLQALGFPESQAMQLMQVAADWIDADSTQRAFGAENGFYASQTPPRGAANGPVVTPAELLDMRGYSPEIYRLLAPHVCALPNTEIGVFNINTLDERNAALMVAVFSGQITLDAMTSILEAHGEQTFPDVETFMTEPTLAAVSPDLRHDGLLGVESKYFKLSGQVVYVDAATSYEAVFQVGSDNSVRLIRRRIGVDE